MAKAGCPTDLTDELIKKIKQCILDGKNLKDTATEIFNNYVDLSQKEIDKGLDNYIQKLYNWNCDNYLNISDKIEGWRRDRMLKKAVNNLEDIMELGLLDKENLKVVQDTSKFVAETLGKDNFSKRNELTGKEGKDLTVNVINYGDNHPVSIPAEELPNQSTKGD